MSFLDRVSYDAENGTHMDGAMRYMFIKPEALMGFALHLPEDMRPALFKAMAESVFAAGGASARAYGGDGDALLATIAATAPQLGWGIWTFVREGEAITLTVRNSPFAAGYGTADHPVCAPICGMLRAVGGMVLGQPARVTEDACAAMGAEVCRFTVQPESSSKNC